MAAIPKKLLWLPVLVVVVAFQMMQSKPSPSIQEPQGSSVMEETASDASSLCSNQELIQGRWTPMTLERPPYIPLSPRVRCMPSADFYKPFATHIWKPDLCRLADWDPPHFARLLSNQTIVFVGDSLSLEHYASLVHLLGDRARLPPKAVQHKRIRRHICHNSTASERHCVAVVFKTDFSLHDIVEEVETSHPTVLVLNRGAHFVSDDELLASLKDHTLSALHKWNQQCSHSTPGCLLVWRTTVPGHPFCHNFTQPATSVEEMQRYIEEKSTKDNTVYRKGEYHWQAFQRQNQLVVQLLRQEQGKWPHLDLQIMDSYQTNILRPDYHRAHMNDCLHSCSPGGGSDLNSQWLWHMLVLREQQKERMRPS